MQHVIAMFTATIVSIHGKITDHSLSAVLDVPSHYSYFKQLDIT